MVRMKQNYKKAVSPKLLGEFSISNVMALPRIEKVVVNVSLGRILQNTSNQKEFIKDLSREFSLITGQKPVVTKAKKSIASFKLREGNPVGLKTTLRGVRMYDFLDRLIHITLPRSRDFHGIDPKAIDMGGNLTIGMREHTIFPELEEISRPIGFEITVVTNAKSREQAIALFRSLGFPLKKVTNVRKGHESTN